MQHFYSSTKQCSPSGSETVTSRVSPCEIHSSSSAVAHVQSQQPSRYYRVSAAHQPCSISSSVTRNSALQAARSPAKSFHRTSTDVGICSSPSASMLSTVEKKLYSRESPRWKRESFRRSSSLVNEGTAAERAVCWSLREIPSRRPGTSGHRTGEGVVHNSTHRKEFPTKVSVVGVSPAMPVSGSAIVDVRHAEVIPAGTTKTNRITSSRGTIDLQRGSQYQCQAHSMPYLQLPTSSPVVSLAESLAISSVSCEPGCACADSLTSTSETIHVHDSLHVAKSPAMYGIIDSSIYNRVAHSPVRRGTTTRVNSLKAMTIQRMSPTECTPGPPTSCSTAHSNSRCSWASGDVSTVQVCKLASDTALPPTPCKSSNNSTWSPWPTPVSMPKDVHGGEPHRSSEYNGGRSTAARFTNTPSSFHSTDLLVNVGAIVIPAAPRGAERPADAGIISPVEESSANVTICEDKTSRRQGSCRSLLSRLHNKTPLPHTHNYGHTAPLLPSSISFAYSTGRDVLRYFVENWRDRYSENGKAYKEGGYLTVEPGKLLHSRYIIIRKLGWGEFSTVWLAYDKCHPNKTRERQLPFVAVKIAKCHPAVTQSTKYEIYLLRYLTLKLGLSAPLTNLIDCFEVAGAYGTHICTVMPLHGSNMLAVIDQMKSCRERRTAAVVSMIKDIIYSVLVALRELGKINVIHTDIKPENVLSIMPDPKVLSIIESFCRRNQLHKSMDFLKEGIRCIAQGDSRHIVCLADFGLSVVLEPASVVHRQDLRSMEASLVVGLVNRKEFPVLRAGVVRNIHGTLIQTREYRAPEVLLGLDLTCQTDVWNVGCMVFELLTGDFLLDPKRKTMNEREMDIEHMAMIMQLLGPLPSEVTSLRTKFNDFYDQRRKGVPPPTGGPLPPRYIHRFVDHNGHFIYEERYRHIPRRDLVVELEPFLDRMEARLAADFILQCLHSYDPAKRPSPDRLLSHPWLSKSSRSPGSGGR